MSWNRKSGLKPSKSASRKQKSVAQLKKECDKWWSLYVRVRDSDAQGIAECITCGAKKPYKELQCGHFISRRVNSLRFLDENTHAQCYACNVMRYGEQYNYAKQIDLRYGDGKAEELHNRRFETHKFTREELQEIITDCKTFVEYTLKNP